MNDGRNADIVLDLLESTRKNHLELPTLFRRRRIAMMRVVLFLFLASILAAPLESQAQSGLQWIDVQGAQGAKLRAVVFSPLGRGPFPVVVYLHGSTGMDDGDVEVGASFAREGFVTLVGCWFQGLDVVQGGNPCPDAPAIHKVLAVKNVVALMDAGRQVPGARRDRVGLVGLSRGGGLAAAVASSHADFQAAVAISGRFELDYSDSDASALSQVQNLRVPLLILQGTADNRAKPGSP